MHASPPTLAIRASHVSLPSVPPQIAVHDSHTEVSRHSLAPLTFSLALYSRLTRRLAPSTLDPSPSLLSAFSASHGRTHLTPKLNQAPSCPALCLPHAALPARPLPLSFSLPGPKPPPPPSRSHAKQRPSQANSPPTSFPPTHLPHVRTWPEPPSYSASLGFLRTARSTSPLSSSSSPTTSPAGHLQQALIASPSSSQPNNQPFFFLLIPPLSQPNSSPFTHSPKSHQQPTPLSPVIPHNRQTTTLHFLSQQADLTQNQPISPPSLNNLQNSHLPLLLSISFTANQNSPKLLPFPLTSSQQPT